MTTPDPGSDAERVKELEAEVESLRARLKKLEAAQAGGRAPSAPSRPAPSAAPVATSRPKEPHPDKVLVVEDHPTDIKVTQMMLESLGYAADFVRSGQEALMALEDHMYDIVLMDVQLPVMDGLETTRQIRQRWPGGDGPRIVALTGRTLRGDREACLAAGMDDYVSKPIPLKVLEAKLRGEGNQQVDRKALDELARMAGRGGIVQLIDIFLRDLPRIMDEARKALEGNDPEALHLAVHPLKSASATLGAKAVSMLARKLDNLGRSGTLEGAADVLARLEGVQTQVEYEFAELRKAYESGGPRGPDEGIPDTVQRR